MMHRVSTIGTPNVQADVGAVGNYPGRTKPGFVVGALVHVLKRNSKNMLPRKEKLRTKRKATLKYTFEINKNN